MPRLQTSKRLSRLSQAAVPERQPCPTSARSKPKQLQARLRHIFFIQHKQWREKERAQKAKNERLRRIVDAYKTELRNLKEECSVSAFLEVAADATEGSTKAVLLADQVKNYR